MLPEAARIIRWLCLPWQSPTGVIIYLCFLHPRCLRQPQKRAGWASKSQGHNAWLICQWQCAPLPVSEPGLLTTQNRNPRKRVVSKDTQSAVLPRYLEKQTQKNGIQMRSDSEQTHTFPKSQADQILARFPFILASAPARSLHMKES